MTEMLTEEMRGSALVKLLPPGVIVLRQVGPKAALFLSSSAFACGIMGPVGSGKTITCCQKTLRVGAIQTPVKDRTGIEICHAKVIVVGKTYPVIDANLLPSWFRVVPEDVGQFSWDAPRTHTFQKAIRKDADGNVSRILDMVVEFRAIGDKSVEEALRGSECTAAWLYEMDQMSEGVFDYMSGRVGRYSRFDGIPVVAPQIFGDFNAPDIDNWTYTRFVDEEIDDEMAAALKATLGDQPLLAFFAQPPAIDKDGNVNPNAENKVNLDKFLPGYYERQFALNRNKKNYLDRMLRNKFVPMQTGQPVFGDEFDPEEHCAGDELKADPNRKLIVGLDAGLTPAAVICQRDSLGRLRVLAELAVFADSEQMIARAGPTRFGTELRRFLLERFPLHYKPAAEGLIRRRTPRQAWEDELAIDDEKIEFWCDPAGKDGTDGAGDELSWLEIVQSKVGYRLRPARSNRLNVRLDAVRNALAERGGFIMSKSCKILRKGFISGYHYMRVAIGDGTGRFNSEPNKNQFSHSQDALQYAAMADASVVAEILGKDSRKRGRSGRDTARQRVDYGNSYFSGER